MSPHPHAPDPRGHRSPGSRCTSSILVEQSELGVDNISSDGLAELAGVNAAKVRKDLSYLGSFGPRGVGYEVDYLVYQISKLGLDHDWPVVIVGAGNLGQALAGYGGFNDRGFPVAGIVDIDPAKVDTVVGGAGAARALAELGADRGVEGDLDRRHRHPSVGRPGRRRPARQGGCHEHPQLCSRGAVGACRGHGP